MSDRSLGHRGPLLWLTLPMMAGLSAAQAREGLSVPWLLGTAGVCALAAVVLSRRGGRWWSATLAVGVFCAGVASYTLHRPRLAAWDTLPAREAKLTLELERLFTAKDARKTSGLATISGAEPHLRDLTGQRVYFSLSLRKGDGPPVRSAVIRVIGVIETLPRNPRDDSFDGYLANAGANFRLTRGRILGVETEANAYRRFCAGMLTRFTRTLGLGVEAKRPEFTGVLRAMLLGQQNELSEEQAAVFRQSGTMHIFSISGLHIAVIAGAIQAILLLIRADRWTRLITGLAALWLYVDITGTAPSAVRAFVMVALVQLSFAFRVPANPVAALASAAWLVLIFDPLGYFSTSFRLSYAIVAALLLLGLPLSECLTRGWSPFRDLPKITWRWWHHAIDGTWRKLSGLLAIGVSISLVSTLCGVMYFQMLTPAAVLVNLAVVPAALVAILGGFVSLLCGLVGFDSGSILVNHAAVLVIAAVDLVARGALMLPAAWFTAGFKAPWVGPASLGALLASLIIGYARNWRGWWRGYWPPVAIVAVTLLFGVRLGN